MQTRFTLVVFIANLKAAINESDERASSKCLLISSRNSLNSIVSDWVSALTQCTYFRSLVSVNHMMKRLFEQNQSIDIVTCHCNSQYFNSIREFQKGQDPILVLIKKEKDIFKVTQLRTGDTKLILKCKRDLRNSKWHIYQVDGHQ